MTGATRKIISTSAGILAFLIAAILIGFWSNKLAEKTVSTPFPEIHTTSFDLPSTQGGTISNKDLIGSPTALFFGFTHCPEICPATLYTLSEMIGELGPDAADIQIVFATVDPERDTVPILKDYIDAINEDVIGLSGTTDQMSRLARDFGIYAKKVSLDDGDYTMDHTATVFLYDAEGRISGTIAWGEPDDFAIAKLKSLSDTKS
jgi:protein SCO1/2